MDRGESLLSRYVSNLTENVYVIHNLPEEVVAVVLAFVSRSPKGFRENLLELLQDDSLAVRPVADAPETADDTAAQSASAKAAAFHEKWVVGYGHASVAEHAVAHVGIEKISRLASAELELSNPFLSFTEFSQRYQKPRRGDYYTPPRLARHPRALAAFREAQEETYSAYETILGTVWPYLVETRKRRANENEETFRARMEKLAFEDARYALTLAVYTNLGMTGNGRALRDSVVALKASPYEECRELALAVQREVSAALPALLRHTEPTEYQLETAAALQALAAQLSSSGSRGGRGGRGDADGAAQRIHTGESDLGSGAPAVELLDFTGKGSADPDSTALDDILQALDMQFRLGLGNVHSLPSESKRALFHQAIARLGPFDHPLGALDSVRYRLRLHISEANWHQLLRHMRKIQFYPAPPAFTNGVVIPPTVRNSGADEVLLNAIRTAEQAADVVREVEPDLAVYLVTNAHRRAVIADFSLWELHHLVNLRGKLNAQWDIRKTVLEMAEQIAVVHPSLAVTESRAQAAGKVSRDGR